MKCEVELISALADGDLSPGKAARVRAHVDGCARCARALGDLEVMKRGLGALPERAGEDNWSVLVNRVAQSNAARGGSDEPRRWLPGRWLPSFSWRWAAPALTLLMLGGGGGAWLHLHNGRGLSVDAVIAHAESEFHKADSHYRRAVDELRAVAEKQRNDWALPKRAEYDAAQKQLEAAVARCHQVAEERPADVDAEELLFAAYRKEIRFFEDQMMREPQ